jgi:hypothetical protein
MNLLQTLQRTPINREQAAAPLGSRTVRENWLAPKTFGVAADPVLPASVAQSGSCA